MKASKESDILVNDHEAVAAHADSDSADSLSETRAAPHTSDSDSSVDQENPYPARTAPPKKAAEKTKATFFPLYILTVQIARSQPTRDEPPW